MLIALLRPRPPLTFDHKSERKGKEQPVSEPSTRYEDRPLVYIAGPYTNPDPVANTHGVIRLASEMIDEGLVTPVIPHLTLLWHLVSPRPLDFWYAYDVALLRRCDALFRVEGASSGADMEVDFADV